MAKIYTKTGDKGTTGLVGGRRVPKNSEVIEFIGNLDELNAMLGTLHWVNLQDNMGAVEITLLRVQRELFTIGALIAGADEADMPHPDPAWMEDTIDAFEKMLEPLKNFILPGGCAMGGNMHLARAVCRRAERSFLPLYDGPWYRSSSTLVYLNRLSDLLFVMARHVNAEANESEIIWTAEVEG